MSTDPRLSEPLARWELLRQEGCSPTPEEVCHDRPELIDSFRKLIEEADRTAASAEPNPPPPESTSSLGRFHLLRLHARGGLGEVLLAHDDELNREVALKRIQPHVADNSDLRRRFLLEAEVTGRLEHPGIVPVYGLGADADGRPFYAMRFIRGRSLRRAIADGEGLRSLLARFVAVCNAIAYAHSKGVIHRDLKPANVMLGEFGETLVVDWGLAKDMASGGCELPVEEASQGFLPPPRQDAGLTRQGQTMGTPAFMSPEQASGQAAGPASDVYSLGATLYAILTHRPPVEADSVEATLDRVRRGEFPAPSSVKHDVPAALEAVCLKAMALDRDQRYAAASDLGRDVQAWLDDEPVTARSEPMAERFRRMLKRHRSLATAVLAAGAVALVAMTASTVLLNEANEAEKAARAEAESAARTARGQRDEANTQRGRANLAREQEEQQRQRAEGSARLERRQRYVTNVGLAYQSWQGGQADRARRFLADLMPTPGREDVRGFEWRYLWRQVREPDARTFRRHAEAVTCLAFSPNGREVVSAGADGVVHAWEAETGKVRRVFSAKTDARGDAFAALSRDGRLLVTALNRAVRLLDAGTGDVLHTFQCDDDVIALALSPDARLAATAGKGGIRLWDVERRHPAGVIAHRLPAIGYGGGVAPVQALAFAPDGKTLLAGAFNHLLLCDPDRRTVRDVAVLPTQIPQAMAVHPDSRQFLLGLGGVGEQNVELWDLPKRRPTTYYHGHAGDVFAAAFSPDGEAVFSGGADNTARMWDRHTGRPLAIFPGHSRQVRALAVSPDGKALATGDSRGDVILHSIGVEADAISARSRAAVEDLALTPDGKTLFVSVGAGVGDPDSFLGVWDVWSRRYRGMLQGPAPSVWDLAFLPDGKTLLAAESPGRGGSLPGVCRLFDTATGKPVGVLDGHRHSVTGVVVPPDGGVIITAGGDAVEPRELGEVIFWDPKTLRPTHSFRPHPGLVRLVLSADGKTLLTHGLAPAARDRRGEVSLWDIATGRRVGGVSGELAVTASADLSPDGKFLVTATGDAVRPDLPSSVQLWDAASSRPVASLTGHTSNVECVQFAPGGKSVWAGGWDGVLREYEVPSGKLARALPRVPGIVTQFAIRRDGKSLAVGVSFVQGPKGQGPSLVLLLDAVTGKETDRFPLTPSGTVFLRFAPNEKSFAAATNVGDVVLLDLGGKPPRRLAPTAEASVAQHSQPVTRVAVSSDGKTLATGSFDGTVKLWDVAGPGDPVPARPRQTITAGGVVSSLAFSPDGKTLAWGTGGVLMNPGPGGLTLYDVAADKAISSISTAPAGVTAVAFSPDGRTLAAATDHLRHKSTSSELWLIDPTTGALRQVAYRGAFVSYGLAFSPDGRTIAFSQSGDAQILEWESGRHTRLSGHTFVINRLSFTPDGKSLVTAGADGAVKFWQVATGREILSVRHDDPVQTLAFSRDGKLMATGGRLNGHGAIQLWRVDDLARE